MAYVGTGAAGLVLTAQGVTQGASFKAIGTQSGLTLHGLIVGQNAGAFTATGAGTLGQLLQSQGASSDPTYTTATYPSTTTIGSLIYASANNVYTNLPIGANGQVLTVSGGVPAWSSTSSADLHVARFIVSAGGGAQGANYTTIAAAMVAAQAAGGNQTIFLQPGTYVENINLVAGINLTAFSCDAYSAVGTSPNVIIQGKLTATFAGNCSISAIQLKTNSDFCLSVTGSAATTIQLKDCFIDANNNVAIQFTSSSGASKIELYTCKGNLDTTGISFFTHSASGKLAFYQCAFENNGVSTTAATCSSGSVNIYNSYYRNAITTSGTSGIIISNTEHHDPLIIAGSGTNSFAGSSFDGGTSTAITVNTNTLTMSSCSVSSTNTNAISGNGTILYDGLSYNNTSVTMNTTTQTPNYMDLGKYRARGQPCFYAYLSADLTAVVGNSGSNYVIVFNTLNYDLNSNFNTGTGTFTAPVAGKYLFSGYVRFKSLTAAMTYGDIRLVGAGDTFLGGEANIGAGQTIAGTAGQYGLVVSTIINMAASDTMTLAVVVQGGASAAAGIVGAKTGGSYFTGYLVA